MRFLGFLGVNPGGEILREGKFWGLIPSPEGSRPDHDHLIPGNQQEKVRTGSAAHLQK
jgi:hypothetical protein